MSLSKTSLSAIQQAGQALHKATVVVADAVRAQAEHMVATVASQPFQVEGEQAFTNFKMLARLSQDLLSLEDQLKNLYATASELASPEMDVVAALPHGSARIRAAAALTEDVAEDVVAKTNPTRRAKPATKRVAKSVTKPITKPSAKSSAPPIVKPIVKATAKSTAKPMSKKAAKPVTLTVNDNKVLQFMKSVLKPGEPSAITGTVISKGASLPLGSVGISVKKVLASGAVKKSGRGTYLIGA
jgi:hypothetical protein